ncbi:MAG: HD domain-containing phosphohydrolase [Candidatus Omnitrophota bacterium]
MTRGKRDAKIKHACRAGLNAASIQTEGAYADMLLRLAVAAEYKGRGIGGHIMRVSDYSVAIGRSLGLSECELEILRYASMMHDIGKIGIPDFILKKRVSLTPREYKKIKEHTVIGGNIFSGSASPLVKAAAQVSLTHHEKYDGTGYPAGRKGDEIPLNGRIVALADNFDAITSQRSYKSAFAFDKAVEMIKKGSDTFFDPKVVSAFLKIKDTIRDILDANITIEGFRKKAF